jgi:hypothetical protein
VIVIAETRYGGVYEGGPWAAFAVASTAEVPPDAFSGDIAATDWWDAPTVPVAAEDTPDRALRRLHYLLASDQPLFAAGASVRVAPCTPSDWYAQGVGRVIAAELRRRPAGSGGPPLGRCVYAVQFEDVGSMQIPESYLREG